MPVELWLIANALWPTLYGQRLGGTTSSATSACYRFAVTATATLPQIHSTPSFMHVEIIHFLAHRS
jgi:hypothetical protein